MLSRLENVRKWKKSRDQRIKIANARLKDNPNCAECGKRMDPDGIFADRPAVADLEQFPRVLLCWKCAKLMT